MFSQVEIRQNAYICLTSPNFIKMGIIGAMGLTAHIYPNLLKDIPVTKHHVILKIGSNHQVDISITFSPEQGMPVTQRI